MNLLLDPQALLLDLAALAPKLVELALGATVLVAAAALANRWARTASMRHLLWAMTLASLLALPVLGLFVPTTASFELAALGGQEGARAAAELPAAHSSAPRSSDHGTAGASPSSHPDRTAPSAGPDAQAPASASAPSGGSELSDRLATAAAGPQASGVDAPPATTVGLPATAAGIAVIVWLLGALALAAALAHGLRLRSRLLRAAQPFSSETTRDLLADLPLGGRRPLLRATDAVEIPVTWGTFRPVVLLPHGAREWSPERLRSVLLHELAHAHRADVAWNVVARLARALYWPLPPVWWAAARLVTESELACDDRVVRAGVAPDRYAEDLVGFARELHGRLPEPVAAMARRSGLSQRIHAVLDAKRDRTVAAWPAALATATVIGGLVTPLIASVRIAAPGSHSVEELAQQEVGRAISVPSPGGGRATPTAPVSGVETSALPTASRSRSGSVKANLSRSYDDEDVEILPGCGPLRSTQIQRQDEHYEYEMRSESCRFDIEIDGELVIADDERSVSSVGRGARLDYREEVAGTGRRLLVDAARGSTPRTRYWIEGRERELDGAGRAWLADRLTFLLRITGWQAEERVGRILARSGVEGLFDEIRLIPSDHVSRLYLTHTLEQASLDDHQLRRWITLAGSTIGSDYELAETLSQLPGDALDRPATQRAFVEAAATIGSDYELRRTLTTLLERSDLQPDLLDTLLESALTIGSDFETAELVVALLGRYPAGRPVPDTFFEVAQSIGSDFELRRALSAFLERDDIEPADRDRWAAQLDAVLASATSIGSDFEAAELLIAVAARYPEGRPLPSSYLDVAEDIGSDFEMRRTLSAAIDRDLPDRDVRRVLELAQSIGNDFELAELLIAVRRRFDLEGATRAAFDDALATLNRNEQERVAGSTR